MAINKVEICGVDTSTLPVLKNERMRELFPRIHAGDKEARREFIQGNLRLVLSVIQRFHNRGESVDDLFHVGCIGLIKAIDTFDTGQNVRFSTYAVPIAFPCRNSQCMRRGGDARRQNLKSTVILPSLTITALSHSSTTARRSA